MTRMSYDNTLPTQISSAVRGPDALRQDIADEIADHLACRVETEPGDDATAAQTEAVRAFGDPTEIARELRTVHQGDLIMFQRLMVAALVVIVIGMALSTYFSWSATRAMSTQMVEVTRETNRQFGELTKQLASLTGPRPAAQPARLRIHCYTTPPETPAADFQVLVESLNLSSAKGGPVRGGSFSSSYRTDSSGWIDTGPLPMGVYHLSGTAVTTGPSPQAISTDWTRVVRLEQNGLTKEMRLLVGSTLEREIRLAVPPEVTWDPKAMTVGISFQHRSGPRIYKTSSETWSTGPHPISLAGPTKLTGLLLGRASALLRLPKAGQDSDEARLSSSYPITLQEVQIPEDNEPIVLRFRELGEYRLTGIVYDGSKDRPVADVRIDVVRESKTRSGIRGRGRNAEGPRESLRTDAGGRFGTLQYAQGAYVELHWKTADGKPAILSIPAPATGSRAHYDIDVSKLSTVRLTLPTGEEFRDRGFHAVHLQKTWWEAILPLFPVLSNCRPRDALPLLDWPARRGIDVLMFPGLYKFEVGFTGTYANNRSTTARDEKHIELGPKGGQIAELPFTISDLVRRPARKPIRRSRPLKITRAKLCSEVAGLGRYKELDPLMQLPAGKRNHALLYCEVSGFAAAPTKDKQYRAQFHQKIELLDSKARTVYENQDERIEQSRGPWQQELLLVQALEPPADLPPGEYTLRVTVVDKLVGATCVQVVGTLRLTPPRSATAPASQSAPTR